MTVAATAVSIVAVLSFVVVGLEDASTSRVTIRRAQAITAFTVLGLGSAAVAGGAWHRLVGAAVGAAVVTATLGFPYWLQTRRIVPNHVETATDPGPNRVGRNSVGRNSVGRADLRLGVPFGWTLGWFDVGIAFVGFATALAAGVLYAAATRRSAIPFVPFLAIGLAVGVGWGLWDLLR